MKSLIVCILALVAAPALAGSRVLMETTDLTTNKTRQSEMLLDATRFRVNDGKTSVIFLTDGGRSRLVTLDKSRNEYHEMDQAKVDQLAQQMKGVSAQMESAMQNLPPEKRAQVERMLKGEPPQAGATPAATRTIYAAKGSTTVNGLRCTLYEGIKGRQKVSEVCAAEPSVLTFGAADYQVFEKMREFMSGLADAVKEIPMAGNAASNFAEPGYKGFPVQKTKFVNGKATEREEVTSVSPATFTDADFSTGDATKAN